VRLQLLSTVIPDPVPATYEPRWGERLLLHWRAQLARVHITDSRHKAGNDDGWQSAPRRAHQSYAVYSGALPACDPNPRKSS
jgi:hypothetical protein